MSDQFLMSVASRIMRPVYAQGRVIKGFGRGSKELGIPTGNFFIYINMKHKSLYISCTFVAFAANFPEEVVESLPADLNTGIYYGWAKVDDEPVRKMVVSVGWNPYYKNEKKSMVRVLRGLVKILKK